MIASLDWPSAMRFAMVSLGSRIGPEPVNGDDVQRAATESKKRTLRSLSLPKDGSQ
jgi:hypothetical protein